MRTQYITDTHGKKVAVILPVKDYEKIMDELDEFECIKAYDKAIKNDTGKYIPMDKAFKMIEEKRKKAKSKWA